MGEIKQKNIVLIDLNPTRGSEQKGTRPAVVISGNAFHVSGLAIVCPLTSKIKNYEGNVVLRPNKKNGLSELSEILVNQIRTISQDRISKVLGEVSDEEAEKIFEGFNLLCDR